MLNNISIMGRMVKDPELRKTTSGKSICSFIIANERSKSSVSGEKEVDYLEVVAWNQSAEFVEKFFKKGSPILVTGRVQTRTYEDSDGAKRKVWNIVANSVEYVPLAKRSEGEDLPNDNELPF